MSEAPPPSTPPGTVAVLIPAAGAGLRMGSEGAKALRKLAGRPLIVHTVAVFAGLAAVDEIRVIARPQDFAALDAAFARDRPAALGPWVAGGAERQESVHNGLLALAPRPPARVLIHDAARPLCSRDLATRVLEALEEHAAVVPTLPIYDTVRRVSSRGGSEDGQVTPREDLRLCQTPQGFHWPVLLRAYAEARAEGRRGTDCAALVQACGIRPAWIAGERRNVKLTTAEDLPFAEWALAHPDWGRAAPQAEP